MTMLTFTRDKWDFVQSIAWIIFVSEVLFVRFPSCYCNFLFFQVFVPNRILSYKNVDVSNINVMLNSQDVSEYLKIASTGLEVTFESSGKNLTNPLIESFIPRRVVMRTLSRVYDVPFKSSLDVGFTKSLS